MVYGIFIVLGRKRGYNEGENCMKHKQEIKALKDLNLMDRFLFAEAADQPEFMELLLSILFDEEIRLRHPPQTEKEARSPGSQKQIRMDVWAMDEQETIYNAESQQQNTYNLPKRSRYYQGLLDSRLLEPGNTDYNQLNDVYLIVIMPFDLFRQKRYRYTFEMGCREIPGVKLQDGAVRIFLNTKGTNPEGVSRELMDLLHYFEETTDSAAERSGSPRIRRMQEIVAAIKSSEDVGVKYMQAWEEKVFDRQEGFAEGLSRGRSEGLEKGQFETLGGLVQDGILSLEQAAERLKEKGEEFLCWYEAQTK